MSHSIIRVQKMKSPIIKSIQNHNQREKDSKSNPDIQKDTSHLNYDLINGKENIEYKKEIEKKISENVTSSKTIRKDAVRLAEFLITSDTDFFDKLTPDEQKRYFETAKDFIADKYGEQNLIYAIVHLDEKTPHMHVGLVPVTEDGRLAAKDVFGRRMEFVKLQDNFNAHVNAHGFDLERGTTSSRKHLDVTKYKAKTFYENQKETTEKYELTLSKIKAIEEKTKNVEDVKATKKLGHVLMKNEDYNTLVNYAVSGAVTEVDTTDLERKLAEKEKEITTIKKAEIKAQEKLRKSYSKVESETRKTQEKMEELTNEKAYKKLEEIFNEQEIVKKYNTLATNYEDKVKDYSQLERDYLILQSKEKSYLREEGILNSVVIQKDKEIKSLQEENVSLRRDYIELKNEFTAWKERMIMALHQQFKRIKTFLNVKDVETEKLKALDAVEDRMVADSIQEIEKPKEKQKTMEMEL